MTDRVPEELLREADLISCGRHGIWVNSPEGREIIARALWAERKRGAEIARTFGSCPAAAGDGTGTRILREVYGPDIATAILGGADE